MDELLKALAEAVRSGSQIAGPAMRAYFEFRVIDDVISYVLPCVTLIVLGGLITYTIRWGIERSCKADELRETVHLQIEELRLKK